MKRKKPLNKYCEYEINHKSTFRKSKQNCWVRKEENSHNFPIHSESDNLCTM